MQRRAALRLALGAALLPLQACAREAREAPHFARTESAKPAVRIVVLGDSLALGNGASDPRNGFAFRLYLRALAERPGSTISSFAIGGTTVADVRRLELPRLRGVRADAVLLVAGGNDVVRETSARAFAREYGALLEGIRRDAPHAGLVVTGVPDLSISPLFSERRARIGEIARRNDAIVRRDAAAVGAGVIDLFGLSVSARRDPARFLSADDFHPSDAGYASLARTAWPAFERALEHAKA